MLIVLLASACIRADRPPDAAASAGLRGPRALDVIGTLPDALRESSGLAVSRTQPGILWSHNDSGDAPRLYAIDVKGRLLATVPVANASARDWEDIAAGPCPRAQADRASRPPSCLYIGDIGDNDRVRPEVTVYVVGEPIVKSGTQPSPAPARSFRYRYPAGPEDCEALAVMPNGDVIVVSKGRSGTIDFFRIAGARAATAMASGELITAERQGTSGIQPGQHPSRLATGAAVSPDGKILAVRTYIDVFFFGMTTGDGAAGRWQDLGRGCFLGDAEPQGEGIDYLNADTLLLTSEWSRGRPGTIHRLRC